MVKFLALHSVLLTSYEAGMRNISHFTLFVAFLCFVRVIFRPSNEIVVAGVAGLSARKVFSARGDCDILSESFLLKVL